MNWPAERSTMPLLITRSDKWDAESLAQRLVRGAEQLFEQEGWEVTGLAEPIPGSDEWRGVDLAVERMDDEPEPCDPYAVRLLDYLADCLIVAERSGGPPAEQQALFTGETL